MDLLGMVIGSILFAAYLFPRQAGKWLGEIEAARRKKIEDDRWRP